MTKYHERNDIDKDNLNKKNGVQDNRISSLEGEIELLKSLGGSSGGGGGDTSGMLDALKGMNEKLRNEFQDKIDELVTRMRENDAASNERDTGLDEKIKELTKRIDGNAALLDDHK